MGSSLRMIWRASVRFGFRILYHELAWAYDFISRTVSQGQWRQWQRAALPHLRGPRVLDLGCGTGDLLLDLSQAEHHAVGLDLSPAMLGLARAKLDTSAVSLSLIRARAQALPFREGRFQSVVVSFPSRFILAQTAQEEIARVLAPGGRFVLVDGGRFSTRDLWARLLNRAFDLTSSGETRPGPEWLKDLGFSVAHRTAALQNSTVAIYTGTKPLP